MQKDDGPSTVAHHRVKVAAMIFETAHDKTNKMACAPSEDSDQPRHLPSLIRVFAVGMKKVWVLSYPLSAQQRLIRLGGCPGRSESLLGTHANLLVLSCAGSFLQILMSEFPFSMSL